MRNRPPFAAGRLACSCAALAVCFAGSAWLEASMARHMLIQLPLLVVAGWLASRPATASPRMADFDEYGISGLSGLLFISAYWMVPRALELSLASPIFEAAKFSSLFLLGLVLPGSLRRCPWVVQLFFLGNFGAMMAIAGIQYQNLPQRLCNAYLLDDQSSAGMGLVTYAVVISIAWCVRIAPSLAPAPTVATFPVPINRSGQIRFTPPLSGKGTTIKKVNVILLK
jgi:hypothetical protein